MKALGIRSPARAARVDEVRKGTSATNVAKLSAPVKARTVPSGRIT